MDVRVLALKITEIRKPYGLLIFPPKVMHRDGRALKLEDIATHLDDVHGIRVVENHRFGFRMRTLNDFYQQVHPPNADVGKTINIAFTRGTFPTGSRVTFLSASERDFLPPSQLFQNVSQRYHPGQPSLLVLRCICAPLWQIPSRIQLLLPGTKMCIGYSTKQAFTTLALDAMPQAVDITEN